MWYSSPNFTPSIFSSFFFLKTKIRNKVTETPDGDGTSDSFTFSVARILNSTVMQLSDSTVVLASRQERNILNAYCFKRDENRFIIHAIEIRGKLIILPKHMVLSRDACKMKYE